MNSQRRPKSQKRSTLKGGPARLWLAAVVLASTVCAAAQTRITAPNNKYTPKQDVEVGRQAATEAEKQLPILQSSDVREYVSRLGRRLADSIPPEFHHPEFVYSFKVIDARDINAFALPGGPLYVNRGMIEAARTEGEVAGVIAHEISHVALRHGTAQATKAEKLQFGAIAGAILGSILGGNVGQLVAEGSQFGLGAVFLRFSRDFEKQADLLGARIMARAGYSPREMASMFQTLEKQGGASGPQWMSDHPNPGNRSAYIIQEAQYLKVDNPVQDGRDFSRIQESLRRMPRARTTEEILRSGERDSGRQRRYPQNSRIRDSVDPPSSRYQDYVEGNQFRISVPQNWRELPTNNSVTFAPDGAYGEIGGQSIFTHGVEAGISGNETHNLEDATAELADGLMRGNRNLRQESDYRYFSVARRRGLVATFSNASEISGRNEMITLYTTLLGDGSLFYLIAVAPQEEYRTYQSTFDRVVRSVQLTN